MAVRNREAKQRRNREAEMSRILQRSCRAGVCLAGLALAGCDDLSTIAVQPHSLVITPMDTLVTEGGQAQLRLTVLDKDGNVIPGPPDWTPATWVVAPRNAISVDRDGTFTALGGAEVRVVASVAGLTGEVDVRTNPHDLELSAGAVYLTQAAQNLRGDVPLIAGRDAFLRVFPVGDEIGFFEPGARATFYLGGEVVHTATLGPVRGKIFTEPQEENLQDSNNSRIPGSVIQPGLEMVVELDPGGAVPLAPGSRVRIPDEGRMRLNVVEMPLYHQTIVPVVQTRLPSSAGVVDWAEGRTEDDIFFGFARKVMPIGKMKVTIHDPVQTTVNLTNRVGWNLWIREIRAIWELEGRQGYYYGTSLLPRGSPWGGLGYFLTPVSVGINRSQTYTHEIGHNMSLRHIDCGNPDGPDLNYPHDPTSIGIYGFDVEAGGIIHPKNYVDLMSYCDPAWVSDYSFRIALNRRLQVESAPARAAWEAIPEESTIMLWGSVGEGAMLMEPAFLVEARPSVPTAGGPYRLEGYGPGGELRFGFDFTPQPVEFGGRHFHFHVPYDPARDGLLDRVVLSGPEGEAALGPSSTSPMAIVINRGSGQVRSVLRDWDGSMALTSGDTEILVSDGLPWGSR